MPAASCMAAPAPATCKARTNLPSSAQRQASTSSDHAARRSRRVRPISRLSTEQRAGLALIAAPARRAHPEVTEATGRFERINQTLENALKAGYLSAAQEKSIANNFAGIAAALEKGAGSKR